MLLLLVCVLVYVPLLCTAVCAVFRVFASSIARRELFESDFHKPDVFKSGRAWAGAWDLFRRKPFRVGRGRLAVCPFVAFFFFCSNELSLVLHLSDGLAPLTYTSSNVSRRRCWVRGWHIYLRY